MFKFLIKDPGMPSLTTLYDGKTQLSALVKKAANAEEIFITKNGALKARLVSIEIVQDFFGVAFMTAR